MVDRRIDLSDGSQAQDDLIVAMGAAVVVANLEALALAINAGLPLPRIVDLINETTGRSHISSVVLPRLVRGEAGGAIDLPQVLRSAERTLFTASLSMASLPVVSYAVSALRAAKNLKPNIKQFRDLATVFTEFAGGSQDPSYDEKSNHSSRPTEWMRPVVGCVGLGVMGQAVAVRALQVARAVYVHDVRPESTAALVSRGARPVGSLGEMARVCDTILICVPGAEEVRSVIFGQGGLRVGLASGKTIIDQTTGLPSATRKLAKELAALGVSLIDAPIAGGPKSVEDGDFLSLCGADQGALSMVQGLLEAMGSRVVSFGTSGSGHAAKLVKNAVAICNRFIAYEGLLVAQGRGLDVEALENLVADSSAQTAAITRLVKASRSGEPSATIRLELLAKDQGLICTLASELGAPMGVANLVRAGVARAAKELGRDANIDDIGRIFGLNTQSAIGM